ncbi:XRE family transcriptional regulator [Streptomyces longwoodensis]|uniref:XRE family transcriptional regulator n=1 Tax=Streptomyces longwoodensis TaxID=68231 RepID=UPI0033DCB678
MRSEEREAAARRFGALVTQLAKDKGIAVESGAGGRQELARKLDTNVSMVSRALDGRVLPQIWQYAKWAKVLDCPLRDLMVESGVIAPEDWPEAGPAVAPSVTSPSQPLTPERAADEWRITHPLIRRGLIGAIENAVAMQAEDDARSGIEGDAAAQTVP